MCTNLIIYSYRGCVDLVITILRYIYIRHPLPINIRYWNSKSVVYLGDPKPIMNIFVWTHWYIVILVWSIHREKLWYSICFLVRFCPIIRFTIVFFFHYPNKDYPLAKYSLYIYILRIQVVRKRSGHILKIFSFVLVKFWLL